MRICPTCGRAWVPLTQDGPALCPWCRFGREPMERRVGGRLPGEPAEAKQAPPPSLEEQG
jgi:hypothetical protein